MLENILLGVFVADIIIFPYMFWRLLAVHKERMRMLDRANPRSPDFYDRMVEYRTHTFDELAFKIWKPVKSFYREYK